MKSRNSGRYRSLSLGFEVSVSIYNNMGLETRIELGSVSSGIKTQGSWLGSYGLGVRGWGSVCGGLGAIGKNTKNIMYAGRAIKCIA